MSYLTGIIDVWFLWGNWYDHISLSPKLLKYAYFYAMINVSVDCVMYVYGTKGLVSVKDTKPFLF